MKKIVFLLLIFPLLSSSQEFNQFPVQTQKPPLHGRHWMAVTGKPLAATAGAMIFTKGGNAIDASLAMLAATCTMWDVLSWGGEMQALIYNPHTQKVIAVNGLGVAPTGATAGFFKSEGYQYPPEYGPLAAVTPGTPGALMTVLADYGTMSLKEILAPAMEMAKGYPIEAQTANSIEKNKKLIKQWPYSTRVFLPHLGKEREAPEAGEIFVQEDLFKTLQKLVDTEQAALKAGKSRKEAIMAAYNRFYKGDIAKEIVRGTREQGGLFTERDLADWKVIYEEPLSTNYKGIEVYKLRQWSQGPVMLQALNMLENYDLKALGYNTPNYIHTLYQVFNLAFADRDFYYGDPYFSHDQPMQGLLSKEYAKDRIKQVNPDRNQENAGPGDPYPYQGSKNPFTHLLKDFGMGQFDPQLNEKFMEDFTAGTTSVVAADEEGWVVSMTPSGGWIPATIAGNTGIGLSQRMQSFVLDEKEGPFNVVEPGKRPRVTLTPSLAMKDGKPYLAFAKQGGDEQDQLLLQFFLNVAEFGMTPQEAAEAPGFKSYQMNASFGQHEKKPGALMLNNDTSEWDKTLLRRKGYQLSFAPRTSGPVNAIYFDWNHGSFWGGSSNHGEDYGIGW